MTHCQGCGAALPPSKPRGGQRKWCSETCRRESYASQCVDCGARVYRGSSPVTSAWRCETCAGKVAQVWPEERIIAAIQGWADEYGQPPTAQDWNPQGAVAEGWPEKAERFYAGGWPVVSTVQYRFGSWREGLRAAGFDRGVGERGPTRRRHRQAA